ncbi:uncharacterized protein BXZ73DRAFT_96857 [Epithele typhae]|uniref:uncharacterized protein n=1 Tax=Epithele typhae TaxID=378194 RepID=UPI002008DF27|nr:uncharacterized protein BXZ73DRAFT_96857 [Epithele typhae]KAH9944368.1 hypothetical protein BXZ73DRAFT_96857 [Epithele typhae]
MSYELLLKEPFGPFREHHALTPETRGTTANRPVALDQLILEQDGFITGLSECELDQQVEFSDKPKSRVRFQGILTIQSLDWLTRSAFAHIEEELQKRDLSARRSASRSTLTLASVYRHHESKLKVIIYGVKNLPANYFTATQHVPNGLMIVSSQHKRRYAVTSMHPQTYELSRKYFSRWSLFTTLQDIVALDAGNNTYNANKTPLKDRTPDWFARLYIKHFTNVGGQRQHRTIFSNSDSDLEDTPESLVPGRKMRGGREHVLRHVPYTEVLSFFTEHVEWVIRQETRRKRDHLFDVDVWTRWLPVVKKYRWEAAREGRRWGVWVGDPLPTDEPMEEDEPVPLAPARARPRAKRKASKKADEAVSAPPAAKRKRTAAATFTFRTTRDGLPQSTYDSDFSVESDVPPSSRGSTPEPPHYTDPADPALLALLPSSWFHPPQPNRAGKWACDAPGCLYVIDLFRPTEENLSSPEIPHAARERLRSQKWTLKKDHSWVLDAFIAMTNAHYLVHAEEWGIVFVKENGRVRMRWKNERSHAVAPEDRLLQPRKDNRRPPPPVIKREETSQRYVIQ